MILKDDKFMELSETISVKEQNFAINKGMVWD